MWKRKGNKDDANGALFREKQALLARISELESLTSEERPQHAKATRDLLLGIVDAVDAFDRVFASISSKGEELPEQIKMWIGNFRTVKRLLQRVLTDHDVAPIEDLQDGFEADKHQVFDTQVSSTEPDGTILEEIQKGYTWRGAVLRKSQVVVACQPDETAQAQPAAAPVVESAESNDKSSETVDAQAADHNGGQEA